MIAARGTEWIFAENPGWHPGVEESQGNRCNTVTLRNVGAGGHNIII